MNSNGTGTKRVRDRLVALACATLIGAVAVSVASPGDKAEAQTPWAPPEFVRSIGGAGQAGLYAWGLDYNSFTDEIIVADYLNFSVRRFDRTTGAYKGEFWRDDNKGQPYSIAVDPTNGDIYVSEIGDSLPRRYIAIYDSQGNFLREIRLGRTSSEASDYYAWIDVDEEGDLWVSDSHYWNNAGDPPRIMEYDPDTWHPSDGEPYVVLKQRWDIEQGSYDEVPRMYGIAVSNTLGRVYVSDSINGMGHVWDTSGNLLFDFGEGIIGNDARSVVLDEANNRVWVTDGSRDIVHLFDLEGNYIRTVGDSGPGAGQLAAPRQLAVGPDGNLFVAEYGNWRYQELTPTGSSVQLNPQPLRPAPAGQFAQVLDVMTDPSGNVWTIDGNAQRAQVFQSDGTFVESYGFRGGVFPVGFNYPRGIAIDPATGNVWVANQRGHTVRILTPDMSSVVGVIGLPTVDESSPGFLRWPLDIEFYGGSAIITDRVSSRVKRFSTTTFEEEHADAAIPTPNWPIAEGNYGVAVDTDTGWLYIVDDGGNDFEIYDFDGNFIHRFITSDTDPGYIDFGWDATYYDGRIYVTDNATSRITVWEPARYDTDGVTVLDPVYLGSIGGYGDGPYELRNPAGIHADPNTGLLYVADSSNMRVQVYDLDASRNFNPSAAPTISFNTPAGVTTLPAEPITITGTAADDRRVARVEAVVRDLTTGLYWNGRNSVWQAEPYENTVPYRGASTTAVDWEWVFVGTATGDTYEFVVNAVDEQANVTASPPRTLTVTPAVVDPAAPSVTVTSPSSGAVLGDDVGPAVSGTVDTIAGTTVEAVGISVRSNSSLEFLQLDGSFASTETFFAASVIGGSFSLDLPLISQGGYVLRAIATDSAGTPSQLDAYVSFFVGAVDETAPSIARTSPAGAEVVELLEGEQAEIAGEATDDRGVTAADVAVRDLTTGNWLQADGSFATAFTRLPLALDDPGATTTGFSLSFLPSSRGQYNTLLRAFDAAGNQTNQVVGPIFTLLPTDVDGPTAVIDEPDPGEAPYGVLPVLIQGRARDNIGVIQTSVVTVGVSVTQTIDGVTTWWNGSGFVAEETWLPATILDPESSRPSFEYLLDGIPDGTYEVAAQPVDEAGNPSDVPQDPTALIIDVGTAVDIWDPSVTIASPVPASSFSVPGFDVAGSAADLAGQIQSNVVAVDVRIVDDSGANLQSDGTFAAGETWLPADLATADATETEFSFDTPDLPVGTYQVVARAIDEAGNIGVSTSDGVVVSDADVSAPSVGIASPTAGQEFLNSGFNVIGAATDLEGSIQSGVAAVEVQVTDAAGNDLQPDGSFAAPETWNPAVLTSPSAVSTGYTFDATGVPVGTYVVSVRAVDNSAIQSPTVSVAGVVVSSPVDLVPPTVSVVSPATSGAVLELDNGSIDLVVDATDNGNVASAEVAVRIIGGDWLQDDGSFAPGFNWAPMSPADSDTFTRTVVAAPGNYGMLARATDGGGNVTTATWRPFAISEPAGSDVTPPVVTFTDEGVYETDPFTMTGTVTDETAVARVEVALRVVGGDWLQDNGLFAPGFNWVDADVAAEAWSLEVAGGPDATYGFLVRSNDAANNTAQLSWQTFVVDTSGVDVDIVPPTIEVISPGSTGAVVSNGVVSGVAADDIGLASVQVAIRDATTGNWLKADGSFGPGFVWVNATGTDSWSLPVVFQNTGGHGILARSIDGAGNTTTTAWRQFQAA